MGEKHPVSLSARGSPLDPLRRRLLPALAAFFTIPLVGSCALFPRGPSEVAQGKYYSSANPEYDAFFLSLYEQQVRMGKAPLDYTDMIGTLARELNLPADTPDQVLTTKVREQAQRLESRGTRILLVLRTSDGEPVALSEASRASTATFLVDGNPDAADVTRLTRPIEKVENELLLFRHALEEDQSTLERLGVRVIELQGGVDATFGPEGISKASEVDQNLTDAGKIIALMRARASDLLHKSDERLSALANATNTDDGRLKARVEKPTEEPAEVEPETEGEAAEPPRAKPKPPKRKAAPSGHPMRRPKSGAPKAAREPEFEP